jgi:hypothetical protein
MVFPEPRRDVGREVAPERLSTQFSGLIMSWLADSSLSTKGESPQTVEAGWKFFVRFSSLHCVH